MRKHANTAYITLRGKGVDSPPPRITVIHAMRGLAALCVLYSHLFMVGLNDAGTPHLYVPAITGAAIAASQHAAGEHYEWAGMRLWHYGLNPAHLGVMLFFLISGFVIALSIHRTDPATFLLRRALRIYPTCIVAVLATVLGVAAYCHTNQVTYPMAAGNIIHSALLLSGWAGQISVIPVLWTLAIEIIFYLLLSVVAAIVRRPLGVREIFAAGLAGCTVTLCSTALATHGFTSPSLIISSRWTAFLSVYIVYMLIGSAVAAAVYHERNKKRAAGFILLNIGLYCLALNIYGHYFSDIGSHFWDDVKIFLIFCAALVLGRRMRERPLLNFLGDISYPLYLVHVPLGWIILYELTSRGLSLHVAAAVAVSAAIAAAWGLHVTVEAPSHRYGRRLKIG